MCAHVCKGNYVWGRLRVRKTAKALCIIKLIRPTNLGSQCATFFGTASVWVGVWGGGRTNHRTSGAKDKMPSSLFLHKSFIKSLAMAAESQLKYESLHRE